VANSWLVRHQDKPYGPYTLEQLQALVAGGRLIPDSQVSLDGQIWTSASKLKGLVFPNVAATPRRPTPVSPIQAAAAIPMGAQPAPGAAQAATPRPAVSAAAAVSGASQPGTEFLASTASRSAKMPSRLAKKNNLGLVVILGAVAAFVGLAMAAAYYVFVSSSKENEAVEHVREFCKLTELDGSYFLCEARGIMVAPPGEGANPPTWDSAIVFELRNPRIDASNNSLSEAEKLNGVEWKGSVCVKADAFRRCPPLGLNSTKTWSSWLSDNPNSSVVFLDKVYGHYTDVFTVTRIRGEWEVSPCDPELRGSYRSNSKCVTFKQVEPSDLPK
jgi:hypothetical protein